MPKVSVILPTYNRAHLLSRAIQSVLDQTYQDWELIVVDDGSTDGTADLVAKFGRAVRYFFQTNRGVAAARNRGIGEARGTYVGFLDDDDSWLPEKLERQVAFLERRPTLGFLYAIAQVVDDEGHFLGNKPDKVHPETLEELLQMNFIPTLTVVARLECIKAVGGFDESLKGPDDYDLWMRLAARYDFCGLRETLATYRLSNQSLSSNLIHMFGEQIKIFQKLLRDPMFKYYTPLLKTRLAVRHYLLAKEYYRKRLYRSATRHFAAAVWSQPTLGSYFEEDTDGGVVKLFKHVKPYLATAASGVCAVATLKERKDE
ncbi:MAG: glycosyltransferase [Candidatus Omnitrophica bacterium]|nr:glycosyltransferase [Candidatus Omnitrophota bacterium]